MEQTDLIIPSPCNEGWEKMTPRNNGRHCDSCNKTVVDFTNMDAEAIKTYLDSKENQSVCGHFKNTQIKVSRPKHHQFLVDLYLKIESNFKIPVFKTLTLSLIILCMTVIGCNRPKALRGKVAPSHTVKSKKLLGEVAVEKKDTINTDMIEGKVYIKRDTLTK